MSPRRRDRTRKRVNPMEERVAKATSATSFSKPPPLALPKTAQFFFRHLPDHSRGGASVVPHVEWERKTALRSSIHDAYLRALARLPFNGPHGVRTVPSLLPALLAGGYCFGPLSDGASNVIVNTVWLYAASPPARFAAADTVVDVVDLDDIKQGSFLGLNRVIHDDDHNYDYYYAAAAAAKHPNCEAFAAFAQSGVATSPAVTELLAGSSNAHLSAEDIERLAVLLVRPLTPPLDSCLVLEPKFTAEREQLMRAQQGWRRKLANMAIQHWNRTIGVSLFIQYSHLHTPILSHWQLVLIVNSSLLCTHFFLPRGQSYSSMLFATPVLSVMVTNISTSWPLKEIIRQPYNSSLQNMKNKWGSCFAALSKTLSL